jgi:hypothetical protein
MFGVRFTAHPALLHQAAPAKLDHSMHSDCCTGMHCRYIKYLIVAFIQGAAGRSSGVDRAQCNSAQCNSAA